MRSLIVALCLLSTLTAQTSKKFKNVIIETDNKLMFVNWSRTDSSLLIYETIIDKNNKKNADEIYWWAKKEEGYWCSNLPHVVELYIKSTKTKEDISWMLLPNVSKETVFFGFSYDLIFKKFNFWTQE